MLREENVSLRNELQEAQRIAEKGQSAEIFEKKAKELEEQNSVTLREHVKSLEELVKVQSELKQKTTEKEQLEEDLELSYKQNQDYQQQLIDLQTKLELERNALAAATLELEERLKQKESALRTVDDLSAEKRNLEQRMIGFTDEIARKRKELDDEADEVEQMKKQLKELLDEAQSDNEIVKVSLEKREREERPKLDHISTPMRLFNSFVSKTGLTRTNSLNMQEESSLLDRIRNTIGENLTMMSMLPSSQMRELDAHPGACFGLSFNRNGAYVASCGIDRVVKTWDPDSGTHYNTYTGVQAGINDVSFSEDSSLVLGASTDKSVRVWDTRSCQSKFTLNGHNDKVWTVCCSPLDNSKAVSGGADRCIKVWDIRRGQISSNIMIASTCHSVAITQDGTLIVSGHFDGGVRFWDQRTAKQVHEIKQVHSSAITGVVASNKFSQILTLGRDHKLKLIQQNGFNEIRTFNHMKFTIGREMVRPCFSSDDNYIAAGASDGKVYIWETETGECVKVLGQHNQSVVAVAWSPTGSKLVSADNKGIIKFWE
eukprot:TRINITY_DN4675_c0_g1_i5.p1 TRINITY_DN4675_c0_g1~~TRINITY_DN4675_c0_g1_i5.p1  ORF type:complete len:572 (+),score=90.82 TRINITY_DN4675_c0_g1_i5:87-1718(+)